MPPPNTPIGQIGGPTHTPRNRSVDLTSADALPFRPPPNSPSSAFNSPGAVRNIQYSSLPTLVVSAPTPSEEEDETQKIDYRALTYVGTVNENLICPICRVPLVDPVDTDCDHTFCKECIVESLSHSLLCPIDRHPLSRSNSLSRSHRLVVNQLDGLMVECTSCELSVPRAMLRNHLERYCNETLVKCSDVGCPQLVKRKFSDKGCMHHEIACPDCGEVHQEMDMSTHREILCKERENQCEHCGVDVLRCEQAKHEKEDCPDIVDCCIWLEYGCEYVASRRILDTHQNELCNFRFIGPLAVMMKGEIQSLKTEVRFLSEKEKLQDRRIKFLEGGQRAPYRTMDYAEMSTTALGNTWDSSPPLEPSSESTNEYLLNLIGDQERRVNQLSYGLAELEGQSTRMLYNETMKIKNEMSEMRSNIQLTSMHVRWFMNWRKEDQSRIQQQQKRFGGGGGGGRDGEGGGGEGRASSSDSTAPRRSSADSITRDLITKL